MDRYLVIVPHTDEECVRALKQIEAIGMITHFDWGCKDNDHTGYVCLEAESKDEALLSVPTYARPHARVIRMVKFGPEEVRAWHDPKK